MKGVTFIRVSLRTHAYCLDGNPSDGTACEFSQRGTGQAVRNNAAQRHALNSGHQVFVDVVDRTMYTPDGAS